MAMPGKNIESGLMLINTYSDSDSEDETSITENCSNVSTNLIPVSKNQDANRLPLPSTISQLYEKSSVPNESPQDNPTLHDGRIRSFPHERGNWSTYVFVPYDPGEGFEELVDGLTLVGQQAGIELKTIQETHISLTRTVVLLHHWIESFVSSVRLAISHFPRFTLILGPPAVYCNEERTRTFLGLKVESGSKHLCDMAHALDGCLAEFRLPPFYEDPQFHMSVLWVVGDAQHKLESILPKLQAEFSLHVAENPDTFCLSVTQCLCKTGNKLFTFPMALL
ncbi:U6 snRNA phosphodiesterase 1 [Macrosteles quadrilineatus]|uniref:U6 snRNA phosphodiesterase 1 n=1 Tax=Macrosteles quadrilineatus TaxID=74068 RepID=UPI0023E1D3C8|nr:U6 snRNA phosphodiesterase 1 [Macrosteles quadrilineatus]